MLPFPIIKHKKTKYEAEILWYRVIDGDTVECFLDLGFEHYTLVKVRIKGIDAPELKSKNPLEREAAGMVKILMERFLEHSWNITTDQAKWDTHLVSYSIDKDNRDRIIGDIMQTTGDYISTDLLASRVVRSYSGEGKRSPWSDEDLTAIILAAKDILNTFKG